MGADSKIEWCDHTWNPWRGCKHVSAGCANCYMFTGQRRYGRDPSEVVRCKTWREPFKWNALAEKEGKRRRVFTCSWSDFYIEQADPWRDEAYDVIEACDSLDFLILTKRPERIDYPAPPFGSKNVWLGVSVENRKQGLPRIAELLNHDATIRFLSIEPLLEDLGPFSLKGIDWVIIGGESGPGARSMRADWALKIIDRCRMDGVPVFFKQAGCSLGRAWGCKDRKGGDMNEWPLDFRVREFPIVYL